MPTNRTSRRRGSSTQALVAQWYQRLWPAARTNPNSYAGRDVLEVPLDIEVKGRRDFDPVSAMKQLRQRGCQDGDTFPGHIVMRPFKMGEAQMADWMVIRRLEDDTGLLAELLELRAKVASLEDRLEDAMAGEAAARMGDDW
jgi:hypothetical protein